MTGLPNLLIETFSFLYAVFKIGKQTAIWISSLLQTPHTDFQCFPCPAILFNIPPAFVDPSDEFSVSDAMWNGISLTTGRVYVETLVLLLSDAVGSKMDVYDSV